MTPETLLDRLRKADGFLSGEQLCRSLNLSRTAVWKHIRTLREKGYSIESRTGLGYRLASAPDTPDAAETGAWLQTRFVGRTHEHHEQIDSTNRRASKQLWPYVVRP